MRTIQRALFLTACALGALIVTVQVADACSVVWDTPNNPGCDVAAANGDFDFDTNLSVIPDPLFTGTVDVFLYLPSAAFDNLDLGVEVAPMVSPDHFVDVEYPDLNVLSTVEGKLDDEGDNGEIMIDSLGVNGGGGTCGQCCTAAKVWTIKHSGAGGC